MSQEGELFTKVLAEKDFARLLVFEDFARDWELARDLGEYLDRIEPDLLIAHVILAKAYRHVGDLSRARAELDHRESLITRTTVAALERDSLGPVIDQEERLLSGNP